MKQEEKTRRTRQRILETAVAEFGEKGYAGASLNAVCAAGGVSKGLLYHNFDGKDALYLACMQLCFDKLTAHLAAQTYPDAEPRRRMAALLAARQEFFDREPALGRLFFANLFQPPAHLAAPLRQARQEFDALSAQLYAETLDRLPLRPGVTRKTALRYFTAVTEMYNRLYQDRAGDTGDLGALIADHEAKLSPLLDLMLYGVAVQDPADTVKGE